MAKIGDMIQVQIGGGQGGLMMQGGSSSIRMGNGASMSVPGQIIADIGDFWRVRLSISLDGKNEVDVPKSAVQ